jgi:hypothetical protein
MAERVGDGLTLSGGFHRAGSFILQVGKITERLFSFFHEFPGRYRSCPEQVLLIVLSLGPNRLRRQDQLTTNMIDGQDLKGRPGLKNLVVGQKPLHPGTDRAEDIDGDIDIDLRFRRRHHIDAFEKKIGME